MAEGLPSKLLPPLLVQADMAEPSTMIAQMPIVAGTLVMMFSLSSSTATTSRLIAFVTAGFVAVVFTTWRIAAAMNRNRDSATVRGQPEIRTGWRLRADLITRRFSSR